MILLDTNILIRTLVPGSLAAQRLVGWIAERTELCTSAVCWYEFISGPVDSQGIDLVTQTIAGRIIPFTQDQAQEASRLFNATGRLRRVRIDAMIAAAAIISNARLATANTADFQPFTAFGLRLDPA